jgi:hypothetical protein
MASTPTPLFQLNLMLWLSWNMPPSSGFNPVFRRGGYELLFVSPPIPLPFDVTAKANAAQIPFKARPNPDLLLHNVPAQMFMPIECKQSSFGPDAPSGNRKHQALQCAALLCATGPLLASHLGRSNEANWCSHLVYVVNEGHEEPMYRTLMELSTRLQSAAIRPTPASSIGIYVRPDGVYLASAPEAHLPVPDVHNAKPSSVRVMELEPGDDPRALYLIPYDPSIDKMDEYERQVVHERVRTALAALIGSRASTTNFQIEIKEILSNSIEVWHEWNDSDAKKQFTRQVKAYVARIIHVLRDTGLQCEQQQGVYTFKQTESDTTEKVRRYLTSRAFRKGDIELLAMPIQPDFSSVSADFDPFD